MTSIIDRRPNGKNKSAVNRDRFLRRFKKHLKKAVEDSVTRRSITDIDQGEKINIPAKDITEPTFQHDPHGGHRETILPGNQKYVSGDKVGRPDSSGGQGQGNEASDSGEGNDDFSFEISREEFLELFFEDLALPDLVKTQITRIPNFKMVRSGFTQTGVPTNLNIVRSLKQAIGRRIALSSAKKRKLALAEKKLKELLKNHAEDDPTIIELQQEIKHLKSRIKAIPFLDTVDLRYNLRLKQPEPSSQAVMFCIMDVSGSMDEVKKDIAKRFFIMLYLFLTRNYERIELVFIRHHTSAKEVDEQEFFYSRETGGTVVSSALELMNTIIQKRYSTSEWNLYAAQASDGDNWNADSPHCRDLLINNIIPNMQYFAYVEIMPRHHQSLWEVYTEIKENHSNFAMQQIDSRGDIYPVFRELFKRQLA